MTGARFRKELIDFALAGVAFVAMCAGFYGLMMLIIYMTYRNWL
jgi:hypothetical protein